MTVSFYFVGCQGSARFIRQCPRPCIASSTFQITRPPSHNAALTTMTRTRMPIARLLIAERLPYRTPRYLDR